jgi:phosphohistidine phosphatase
MILYVVRHGVAEDTASGGEDGARRLTARGRTKMDAAARGMRALGMRPEILLTSPLARAAETATILSEALSGRPEPRELAALAQGVAPAESVRALRPFAGHDSVAIVGHEPGLSGIVALLLTGSADGLALKLKKGGIVILDLETVAPRAGTLQAVLTPRQLRRLGRR